MITKGSIVVDELIVPIVDMYLDHGLIVVTAEVCGPIRAVDAKDYAVHDRQGGLLVRAVGVGGLKWRELRCRSDTLTVVVRLAFIDKLAAGVAA